MSNVSEQIFHVRLRPHFESDNLHSQNQHGFQTSRNTKHALLTLFLDVIEGFDVGGVTVATFMELSKVFDCVSHDTLKRNYCIPE